MFDLVDTSWSYNQPENMTPSLGLRSNYQNYVADRLTTGPDLDVKQVGGGRSIGMNLMN